MIKVNNLNFSYENNGAKILKNITFSINDGEIFGLLGPSGAGKSTTQKILTGMVNEYSGTVEIINKDICKWESKDYEKIGISFEFPNLYGKLTAYENLEFIKSLYSSEGADINELLKKVDLYEYKDVKVNKFSKGMKMRLNFIRALVNNPQVLFLDEPLSGLDPGNSRKVKDIILELKSLGKTIVLNTHSMELADEICDTVAFLVDGEIKKVDTPKKLKSYYGENKVKVEYYKDKSVVEKEFELTTIGSNEEFKEILRENVIKSIHSKEANLEEVFIKITGRGLKGEDN